LLKRQGGQAFGEGKGMAWCRARRGRWEGCKYAVVDAKALYARDNQMKRDLGRQSGESRGPRKDNRVGRAKLARRQRGERGLRALQSGRDGE